MGNVFRMRHANEERLRSEYQKLREGLASTGIGVADELPALPVIPRDILSESVPGSIRRSEHFLAFLRRAVEYIGVGLEPEGFSI